PAVVHPDDTVRSIVAQLHARAAGACDLHDATQRVAFVAAPGAVEAGLGRDRAGRPELEAVDVAVFVDHAQQPLLGVVRKLQRAVGVRARGQAPEARVATGQLVPGPAGSEHVAF